MDLSTGRIRNELVFLSATSPVIFLAGIGDYRQMLIKAAFSLMVTAVLFPLFSIGALGGGDVKLCAVIPLYTGVYDAVNCISFSFVIAAVIGLAKLLRNRMFRERMRYFCSYAVSVGKTGRLKIYEQEMCDMGYRTAFRHYQIHFALPVLIAVVLVAAGIL